MKKFEATSEDQNHSVVVIVLIDSFTNCNTITEWLLIKRKKKMKE